MSAIPEPPSLSLGQQISSFSRVYWTANVMEMVERLAYYGVRTVIPTYMVLSLEKGGPEFTHSQKGWILFAWALVQSLLPMFTGGYADRFGYRKTIAVAALLQAVGYFSLSLSKNFWLFGLACVTVAAGTAVFKPGLQGILASIIRKETASVGWGIFYQVVNIGGFLGPILSGYLRLMEWRYVFWSCAVIVLINWLFLLTFDEPERKAAADVRSLPRVMIDSVTGIFKPRLLTFIILFSGFWFMFNQIFDILPAFLDDWVDSTPLWGAWASSGLPGSATAAAKFAAHEPFNQEWIVNLNPGLIVLLMVFIAWLTDYTTPLRSILVGIAIASAGTFFIGFSMSVWACIAAILVFSVGEMASSPKKMQYLQSLAPPGQLGLYMGYANVPLAIGWSLGAVFGGWFYDHFGDRTNLSRKYLVEVVGMAPDLVKELKKDAVWPTLLEKTGWAHSEAIQQLWDLYNPGVMWLIFACIGIASLVGLTIYDTVLRRMDGDKS